MPPATTVPPMRATMYYEIKTNIIKKMSKISVYNAITLKSAKIPLENSAYPYPT